MHDKINVKFVMLTGHGGYMNDMYMLIYTYIYIYTCIYTYIHMYLTSEEVTTICPMEKQESATYD